MVHGHRSPALQGHAGVAPHAELGLQHVPGPGEGRVDIAGLLGEHVGLGVEPPVEVAERADRIEYRRHFRHLHDHGLGAVLGDVRVDREHRGHGLAHVAHPVLGQDRLAVGNHLVGTHLSEVDGRYGGHIGASPDRGHAGYGQGPGGVYRLDRPMGHLGSDDPHVELVREVDVGDESALAPQQGLVLEAENRLADHGNPAAGAARVPITIASGRERRAPR